MSKILEKDIEKPLFITVALVAWTVYTYFHAWQAGEAHAALTLICTGGK